MASSSNSPRGVCKFLGRECTVDCVFAPYFPPDQPTKFANVHKVFGASYLANLIADNTPTYKESAVNSVVYEADAYGSVGIVTYLEHKLNHIRSYVPHPSAMLPLSHEYLHYQPNMYTELSLSTLLPASHPTEFHRHKRNSNNNG
ncbi:protein ASYMMETRIC LEAVES 2-like [Telopea speciosissima]|uniref:protein ASYMMETRIC LEAVES 2-like n=1 Tax=Telopea speciosissima TaxID=54955 RepID=UPI001CC66910|nr:protein ASYMMETRIC LEAVES 2-like [Telopea speciosissima]